MQFETDLEFDDDTHKVAYEYDELGRIAGRTLTNGSSTYGTTYTFVAGGYGTNSTTPLIAGISQGADSNAMNFAYAYDSRGNITSETRNGKVTTYTYDALGQLIRVNDPNDLTAGTTGTTWVYNYDRGGNITSKSYHAYTTGTPGAAIDTIAYSYTDSNWKDKLTAYDGQAITYDAIGNPLTFGRYEYEWQAGRQLKKVTIKADLTEGTQAGEDEQSNTRLEIEWSNGNLISGSVTSTQASAKVTLDGEDVTDSYAASAFDWQRDSGNASADATWNAAHKGKKAITLTAADLSGDVTISCTLTITGEGGGYGSITVDGNMDAHHTPGVLDANDTFAIENGHLMVTTARGNVYSLVNGEVHGTGATLNGSITAQSKLFASQPEDVVEFKYDHNGLRTQKKATKADGTVETTNYTLHGKLVTHLTRGSDEMHFYYDAQSRPAMVNFNGTLYGYVHNLQGDIVGIIDSNGELVVEYKYDAWGKPLLVRTLTTAYETLAELNPFRYRGYVYDEETGLYYLRSRYYDSNSCRFINSDDVAYINTISELTSDNLFKYSLSNPIGGYDPDGTFDFWGFIGGAARVIGGAVAVVAGITVAVAGAPVVTLIAAGVSITAGGLSIANGSSEIEESITGYNPIREEIFGGNQNNYYGYTLIVDGLTIIGSGACIAHIYNNCIPRGAVPGTSRTTTLMPGQRIIRYGSPHGRYMSNPGTPASQLALPQSNTLQLNEYVVLRPFSVETAIVADQLKWNVTGGGVQYFSWRSIHRLVQLGYIRPVR